MDASDPATNAHLGIQRADRQPQGGHHHGPLTHASGQIENLPLIHEATKDLTVENYMEPRPDRRVDLPEPHLGIQMGMTS